MRSSGDEAKSKSNKHDDRVLSHSRSNAKKIKIQKKRKAVGKMSIKQQQQEEGQ